MESLDSTEKPRSFGDTPDVEEGVPTNAEGEEIPTEEEQLQFDMLTARAEKMIFGKGMKNILSMLGSSERPSKGMGQAASMVIKALMQAAKQAGKEIDPNVALEAGAVVVEDLLELGKAKGVFQFESPEEEKQEAEDAMLWGVKFYGDGMIQSGELTPELQQAAQAETQQGLTNEAQQAGAQPNLAMKASAAGVKQAVNTGGR